MTRTGSRPEGAHPGPGSRGDPVNGPVAGPVRGLVLGGGGITGIAWQTGLVAGLASRGVDVTDADLVVGTSAGSVVGARLRSGRPLDDLLAEELEEAAGSMPTPTFGTAVMFGFIRAVVRARRSSERMGRSLGRWSLKREAAGKLPPLQERLDLIAGRLSSPAWPDRALLVTAVDARSGTLRVFDGRCGAPLLHAVAASCAVPGVYPPVPVDGGVYVDGAARASTNADLAASCDRVLVVAPLDRSVGPLRSASSLLGDVPHLVLTPDEASRAAIGKNILHLPARPGCARAGFAQGQALAAEVAAFWR